MFCASLRRSAILRRMRLIDSRLSERDLTPGVCAIDVPGAGGRGVSFFGALPALLCAGRFYFRLCVSLKRTKKAFVAIL